MRCDGAYEAVDEFRLLELVDNAPVVEDAHVGIEWSQVELFVDGYDEGAVLPRLLHVERAKGRPFAADSGVVDRR